MPTYWGHWPLHVTFRRLTHMHQIYCEVFVTKYIRHNIRFLLHGKYCLIPAQLGQKSEEGLTNYTSHNNLRVNWIFRACHRITVANLGKGNAQKFPFGFE